MIITDSRIKLLNIDAVINWLFDAEKRRFKKFISQIHLENQEVSNARADKFQYMGKVYNPDNLRSINTMTLHLSLWDKMDQHLKDVKSIENDEQQIRQTLYKLFDHAHSLQELRDVLPDSIVPLFEQVKHMKRYDEIQWILRNDPRTYKQLQKTIEKIEMYSVTRMLY